MVIHAQRHANVSKQARLLDGLDISRLKWRVCGFGLNRFVHEGMNHISNVKVHLKTRCEWKCKYLILHPSTGLDEQKFLSIKQLIFSYPSVLTYVLGTQKNHLIETVLLNTHNTCFGKEIRKRFFCYTFLT